MDTLAMHRREVTTTDQRGFLALVTLLVAIILQVRVLLDVKLIKFYFII